MTTLYNREKADILRHAAAILRAMADKDTFYFLRFVCEDVDQAAEALEGRPCETCGHSREQHFIGHCVAPQCRFCRCDRYQT